MAKAAKQRDNTEIVEIDDLAEFLKAVEGFAGRSSIFRGLGDAREEHTTLKRSYERSSAREHLDITRYERALFDGFKREAPLYISGRLPGDCWQWLALGRHYGLPTRLLDWSKNPLVALHFAVAGSDRENERRPTIYGVDLGPSHGSDAGVVDPNEHPDPLAFTGSFGRFVPEIAEARLGAQQSVFTLSRDPTLSMTEMLQTAMEEGTIEGFCIWRIPPKAARRMRRQLFRIGMSQLAVFPDLTGLCRTLTWTWEEYRGAE